MSEDSEKFEQFKKDLRSVLICSKGNIQLNRLDSEFYEMCGEHIRYDRNKFQSLEDFLKSIPDTCTVTKYGGDVFVDPVATGKAANILKLVNQQKSISKKKQTSLRRPTTIRQNSSISGNIYAKRYNNHNSSTNFQKNRSNYSSSNNYRSNGQSSRYSTSTSNNNSNNNDTRRYSTSTSNGNSNNNDTRRRLTSSSSFRQPKSDYNRNSNYNNSDNKRSSSNVKLTNGTTDLNGTRIFDIRENVPVKCIVPSQSNKNNDLDKSNKYRRNRYEKNDSVDYKQELEEYAEKHNLGEIRYVVTQIIERRKVCGYYSKCILQRKEFLSFPDQFRTGEEAENAAAKKALNSFKNKEPSSKEENICSEDDLVNKIKQLFIKDDDSSKFSHYIEDKFSEKYSQTISPNWIEIIEKTNEFDLNKIKAGEKTLITIALNKSSKLNSKEHNSNNLMEFSDSNNSDLNNSDKSDDNQELPEVLHLDKNSDWNVLVLRATNAREVVLRLVDNTEKLDLLITQLHNYYNELKKGIKAKNIITNKIYAVVFDDCVFRVQAVQLEGAQVYCWFLDDGIIEKVQKSNLYELPNEFMKLPFQAFTAQLDGLEDQSESLIRKYIDNKMKENDDSLCLFARPIKSDPDLTIRLFDTSNSDNDIDINEDILNYIKDSIKNNIFAGSSNSIPKARLPKELNVSSDSEDGQLKHFDKFNVVVSLAASPHHFIVRSSENFKNNSDYLNLNERLQDFYSRTDEHIELNESMIYPGLFVCVKDDDKWCRARVDDLTIISKATSNSKCTCYLVDLGKIVITDIENIQPLYSQFMDFPLIAIRASLCDILPINDDWSMDQIIYFKNLVEGQEFEAIINDIVYVDNEPFLQLNLRNSSIDISDNLIKNKKAKAL